MTQQPFLSPDVEQIRHQIRGIIDSYSHDWDILSEIAQNAVDAIRGKSAGKGHIEIYIDAPKSSIRIKDNGVGMILSDVQKLLRPFGTNKIGQSNQVGEKGVGLKFVLFSSSNFRIFTNGKEGAGKVEIANAYSWLASSDETPLLLDLEMPVADHIAAGTSVEIILADRDHPIFNYTFSELLFILRTKTACGDTGHIWGEPLNADTRIVHIDKGGVINEQEFECRYMLPTEGSNAANCIALDEFYTWLNSGDKSDAQKRRKLFDKIVTSKGKDRKSGRQIRYWSCFIPGRDIWKILSENRGIDFQPDEQGIDQSTAGCSFTSGFDTSTKGMPTSIRIELNIKGSAGYLPNFFMIVDDPSLRFDIGRKSIQGRQQGMLRNLASANFREYIRNVQKYIGGSVEKDNPSWQKDQIFAAIESLPDLNCGASVFHKRPNGQEAMIGALFFEQLGRGNFKEVSPLLMWVQRTV